MKRILAQLIIGLTMATSCLAGDIASFGSFDFGWGGKKTGDGLVFNLPLTSSLALTKGSGSATFTRASAQYLDVAGVLTSFPSGTAAINSTGYLSESTATNLLVRSQELDNAAWWKGGAFGAAAPVVTANSPDVVDPAGGYNSEKIVFDAVSSANQYSILGVLNNMPGSNTYTMSVYLRTLTGTADIYLFSTNDAGEWHTQLCSVTTSWSRFKVTFTAGAGTFHWLIGQDLVDPNQTAKPVQTVYVYQGDLAQDTDITSPILTTAATATRAATSLSYPTAGNMRSALPMSGTFDWTPESIHAANHWLWGSYTDASNATGVFYDGTNIVFRKRIAGVNYDATKALAATAGTTYTIGWRVNADNSTDVFINHVKGSGHANTTAAVIASTFKIGDDGNGGSGDHGQTRNFKTWFKALADGSM